jgi:DNA primase
MEMGKPSAITIEEQMPQRVRNIYVDWSRATVDMGIVGLGSIRDSNGKVCLPVKQLPEKDTLDDTIKVSNDPSVKVQATFDQKFKSPWTHTIYQNPHLLEEKKLSINDNPMSLVEEIFKDFNWIPNKYIELGSEKFLRKYCW